MVHQGAFRSELFAANLAGERFFPRVNPVVSLELGLAVEELQANVALERFRLVVNFHVQVQVVLVGVASPANRAAAIFSCWNFDCKV